MKYAALIARREYTESIRTKGFWIGICIFPLLLFLMIQVPLWLQKKATPVRHFILVDQSGTFDKIVEASLERTYQQTVLEALNEYGMKYAVPSGNPVESKASPLFEFNANNPRAIDAFMAKGGKEFFLQQLRPHLRPDAPAFNEPHRRFERVALPGGINAAADLASLANDLKPYLCGERKIEAGGRSVDLDTAILIPRDIENQVVRPETPTAKTEAKGIEYWSANFADLKSTLREQTERAVNGEIRRREYLARGMDIALVRQVEKTYAPFANLNPKKETGHEAVNTTDVIRQWAPSGFVYLLWVAIFTIAQMLLNNVIEEKSNRIIEVLLSSVTPGELMAGKLAGIAAIGLTMVGAWMLAMFGILSGKSGGSSEVSGQILTLLKTSRLLPVFSIYFLLGYVLYAAAILSLGSVCNTLKEAQSYMGSITMLMMVPLLTMAYIPTDPNGVVARVLSWIPIYTPFTMMNRINSDPPLVDVIGTMILLLVSAGFALWMAGKIFRIGILRTGQPPRIVEMLRWLKG